MELKTGTALLALFLAGPCFLPRASAQSNQNSDRTDYAARTRETYNFRFGKDKLSVPGNAAVEGDDFIQPGAFPNAVYCAHCHEEAYSQWRQALHSNSFRTPFYRTSVNILLRTKGIEFTRHCDSCHNPDRGARGRADAEFAGGPRASMRTASPAPPATPFKSCNRRMGNGGFVMGVPSVMVDEDGNRIPGDRAGSTRSAKHPDRHSQSGDAVFLPDAGILRGMPQGQPAESVERLQIHPRVHGIRRVAEFEILAAQSADLLFRRTSPLARIATCSARPLTLKDDGAKARHVGFASLAGRQHRRALLLRLRRATAEDRRVFASRATT